MRVVGLIPARSGSKRVASKNVRTLAGHPLIAYAIASARESGIFDDVVVSSDSHAILSKAMLDYGASIIHCPTTIAHGDGDQDILWVLHAMSVLERFDAFAILRVSSPFRSADMIRRAYQRFSDVGIDCHSLRAVERSRVHPYKMWTMTEGSSSPTLWMKPYAAERMRDDRDNDYLWSQPTQTLPHVYAQNASLEIAWTSNLVDAPRSISGTRIVPFFTENHEGFDLNTEDDFILAEALVERGLATLPRVDTRELLEIHE